MCSRKLYFLLSIVLTGALQNLAYARTQKEHFIEFDSKDLANYQTTKLSEHNVDDMWAVTLYKVSTDSGFIPTWIGETFNDLLTGRKELYRSYSTLQIECKCDSSVLEDALIDIDFNYANMSGGWAPPLPYELKKASQKKMLYFGQNFALKYIGTPEIKDIHISITAGSTKLERASEAPPK